MKALLAIPAMLIAMNAAAECPAQRPTELPAVPVATTASQADMVAAQTATQAYVESVIDFVNCRQDYITDLEHNFFIESARSAAENYNETLREFNQREAVASN